MFASGYRGYGTIDNYVLAIAVLVIAAGVTTGRGAALGASTFLVVVVIGCAAAAVVAPSNAFTECDWKCGVFATLFPGILLNENELGMLLVCCLPFVIWSFTGWARRVTALTLVMMVLASGSRSSMLALAVTVLTLWVLRPNRRGRRLRHFNAVAAGAVIAAGGVGLLLPIVNQSPAFATNRGYLWQTALDRFHLSPVIGLGWSDWPRVAAGGGVLLKGALYGPHNEWMHILNVSGLLGIALFAVFLGRVFYVSRHQGAFVASVLVAVLGSGWTENPLSFSGILWITWLFPALLLAPLSPSGTAVRAELGSRQSDTDSNDRVHIQSLMT
jgi:O-antigen ligase